MKIEVSEKLFRRLQKFSAPLVDTPESLISKLLDSYEDNIKESGHNTKEKPTLRIGQDDLTPFIIFILKENGGKLSKSDVEGQVYKILKQFLNDEWYTEKLSSQNVQRWKHNLAWAKEKAKTLGLIKKPKRSERGYWELTDAAHSISFDPDIEKSIISIEAIKRIKNDFNKKVSNLFDKEKIITEDQNPKTKIDCRENIQKTIALLLRKAEDYALDDDLERALECYSAAIIHDPLNTQVYTSRAELHEELENIAEAIIDYRKIIEIEPPDDANFYVNLGILCAEARDDDGAIFYYSKAIQIEPDSADLYFFRACAFERKENKEQAFLDANHALCIKPNEYSYNELVNSLKKKLQHEKYNDFSNY